MDINTIFTFLGEPKIPSWANNKLNFCLRNGQVWSIEMNPNKQPLIYFHGPMNIREENMRR